MGTKAKPKTERESAMMATIVTRGSPRASAPSTSTHRRVTSATLRIGPPSFRNTRSQRAKKKAQLLTRIEDLNRGLLAIGDEEAQREVDNLASALEPLSDSKAKVQFQTFRILGLLPIKAPASAVGELDCTYLDEDMRISRGDKGNLFVLLMEDPSARL